MSLPIAIIVGATGASGGTNAGTSSANGTYIQVTGGNATFNGVAQYTNGTDFLAWDGSTYWQIWTGVNGTGTKLYQVSGGGSTSIPATGWAVSSGASPASTLALVTTGLAVAYIASGAGTASANGTYYPVSGSNALYEPTNTVTQYSNGTYYLSWNSNQWNLNPTVNTVGSSALYSPGSSAGTTFPLTGWSVGTGTSPAPTFSAPSPPTAPSALTLVDNTPTSINVTIPALSGGATSYNLLRAPDVSGSPGTYTTISTGVTPSSTYLDTSLTSGAIYWYVLVGVNTYGSTQGVGTSITETPAAPGQYAATVVNDTTIDISVPTLASVTGATSFNVQRAPYASGVPGTWATIGTGVTPNAVFADTSCSANTQYFYRIVAVNSGGSTNGATFNVVLTAPGQPTGISITGNTTGEARNVINFTPAAGAVMTNVWRSITSGGTYTYQGETTSSIYTDYNVSPGTSYYYEFTSTNSSGGTGAIGTASGPATPGGFSTMTLERANIYEGSQIGPETTPGVAVAATHKLMNTSYMPDITPDIKDVRTDGYKFDTDVSIGKEYTTGKISGKLAYIDEAYNLASLMTVPTISTPANNSTWVLSGASGTIGLTFQNKWGVSATLVPAAFANAAALQTAIGNLASVGPGNVLVTGAAPTYTIQFVGALSTDPSVPSALTGTPTPTIAAQATAALTRRWTFSMNPWGPENAIQTYTLEKGIPGIANYAQQISQLTISAIQLKFSKDAIEKTGDFVGTIAVDPFTMTSLTPSANLPSTVVNPRDVAVYIGKSLFGTNGTSRLKRVFELEWGCTGRYTPVMTLDDSINTFSNTVEASGVKWNQKMTMAQDGYGQAVLADLRANTSIYRIIEARGPNIETGFPLRFKITEFVKLTAGPKQDSNGIYSGAYESNLIMDNTYMNCAVLVEIDIPTTAIA